ncbi:MAG: hypothetical protein ACK4N5_02410 [Myxococcales bacterium]
MHVQLKSSERVRQVDTAVFTLRYFARCMACTFCHDACCAHGVDLDVAERDRILAEAASLQPLVGFDAARWFESDEWPDAEYPSGRYTRTAVVDGACVFLNRAGRGCLLHLWALKHGRDYHALKPMFSALFPLTFDQGVLQPADDVTEDLVCAGKGETLYRAARAELLHYFGTALVAELDALEARFTRDAA